MPHIRSFRELRVWQHAMDATMQVFKLTKRFPSDERYSLTDQYRRASRSVCNNLAEAWRKRRYPAAFVCKLSDAEAEAAECQSCTEISLRCKYLTAAEAADLDKQYEVILGEIVTMISHPEQWSITPATPELRSPRLPVPPSPRPAQRTERKSS